jgi:tetratricopeptide (TPR) repeat protein
VNLAEKLGRIGEYEEAEIQLERGMALANEIGHRWTLADAQRTLARMRLAQGFTDEARAHAQEAHRLFLEIGDEVSARDALELVENGEGRFDQM